MGAFVIVAVAGAAWRFGAARTSRWASIAARLPATRVAELAEGKQVKVVGVVEERETIAGAADPAAMCRLDHPRRGCRRRLGARSHRPLGRL